MKKETIRERREKRECVQNKGKKAPKKDEFSSLSVAELRKRLGSSSNKEIHVRLGTASVNRYEKEAYPQYLQRLTIDQLVAKIKQIAKDNDAPADAELKLQHRNIPITKKRRVSKPYPHYGTIEKVTTKNEGPYWVITFTRPMTDEEIEKDGPTLLRNKKKADERKAAKEKLERERVARERQADIARIKALAAKHGVKVEV